MIRWSCSFIVCRRKLTLYTCDFCSLYNRILCTCTRTLNTYYEYRERMEPCQFAFDACPHTYYYFICTTHNHTPHTQRKVRSLQAQFEAYRNELLLNKITLKTAKILCKRIESVRILEQFRKKIERRSCYF